MIGAPEDIAEGMVYLASDAARFVTGTELVIDGGGVRRLRSRRQAAQKGCAPAGGYDNAR